MSYKIIVDSCCDLTASQLLQGPFLRAPLTISLAGEDIVDDETFDQTHLLLLMAECPDPPKTACPSPAAYLEAFAGAGCDDIYVVTLSAHLSGSHNAAVQARAIWLEEHPDAHVHVFNSCSAAAGEVAVALKIAHEAGMGAAFPDVVAQVDAFIAQLHTYFVLENLDHLRKNGRLTGLAAMITETLRIKLLMGGTREGQIKKVGQALSIKQALSRMVDHMAKDPGHIGKTLYLVHCNNPERAFYVRELALKACKFKEILISDARGVTTVYANNGGVVAAY